MSNTGYYVYYYGIERGVNQVMEQKKETNNITTSKETNNITTSFEKTYSIDNIDNINDNKKNNSKLIILLGILWIMFSKF